MTPVFTYGNFDRLNIVHKILMGRKELTPEEKLQKITKEIIGAKSNYINVNKLVEIIGFDNPFHENVSNPYISREGYKELHNTNEYKENYIS